MTFSRDVLVSAILGICSAGISIGIIGTKNFFVTIMFFIVPFMVILFLFSTFKPKSPERHNNKKDYT